jgi:hypothetical protein
MDAEQIHTEGTNMKNKIHHISRLVALGVLAVGLLSTGKGHAYFSGTSWGWPSPEDDGQWGQGSVWGGSAPNFTNGWSYARYDDDSSASIAWWARHQLNGSPDYYYIDTGASTAMYKLVEHYWGLSYQYGESKIYLEKFANGGCD